MKTVFYVWALIQLFFAGVATFVGDKTSVGVLLCGSALSFLVDGLLTTPEPPEGT